MNSRGRNTNISKAAIKATNIAHSTSTTFADETNNSNSLFAPSRASIQLLSSLSNFYQITNKFQSALMMLNSDDEMLLKIRQATKVSFAEKAGPSNAPPATRRQHLLHQERTQRRSQITFNSGKKLYREWFNFSLSKMFSSTLMASLISKDTILNTTHIFTDNQERCKQISAYIERRRKDLHENNDCVCVDDKIAIPNSINDAYIEAINATDPGSWCMTYMAINWWWPYTHRDFLSKTANCNPCFEIG